jgi:tRNA dimethylallyltransferase
LGGGERAIVAAAALVVIGGSTASGKSALALALARATGGTVVNADSQQLFADLPILTARPTVAEEALAPHRLYGLLQPHEQPSVGRWMALAAPLLASTDERSPLIVTGGTGLYLHALLHGFPAMPEVPAALRRDLRAWAATVPSAAIHARLAAVDPVMAARLRASDPQRLLRALEVVEATGRSLAAWQAEPRRTLPLPPRRIGLSLVPPAGLVNPRIEARLDAMLASGVLAEVAALLRRAPEADRKLPIAKVHGLRELATVVRGELDLPAARAAIVPQVRRYAKRQRTWFRHQLPELAAVAARGEEPALLGRLLAALDSPDRRDLDIAHPSTASLDGRT